MEKCRKKHVFILEKCKKMLNFALEKCKKLGVFTYESTYKKCLREEWGKFTGYQLLSSFWLKVTRTDEDGNTTRWDRGTLPIRNLYPQWWMLRFGRIRKVTNWIWTFWFIVSYWWATQDFWLRTKFAVFCREMRSKKRLFMY